MRHSETERLASWSDLVVARLLRVPGESRSFAPGAPCGLGSAERGMALLTGWYKMGGSLINAPGKLLWECLPDESGALFSAHRFDWLDDAAACPVPEAMTLAAWWVAEWVDRFGAGRGRGWTAGLAGMRALRLVQHGDALDELDLGPVLARHVAFLARRAPVCRAPGERFEGFAGLVHGALALGLRDEAVRALAGLEVAADRIILRDGGVASRDPEALARSLELLGWTVRAAAAHGLAPGERLIRARERGAQVLRALVQPDGRLPRFHGGDAAPGLADATLGLVPRFRNTLPMAEAMGFARLRHGRTSLVMDAAPPPGGTGAHASISAVEVTVGAAPFIINCGPGHQFGARWGRASRTTAAHSTLAVEDLSSSRFGRSGALFSEVPKQVHSEREETHNGTRLLLGHDGYVRTHGLWHERTLELRRDGRVLSGKDALVSRTRRERRRFHNAQTKGPIHFAIRFHLAPDVAVSSPPGGGPISLTLAGGARWEFRARGENLRIDVEDSVFFPQETPEPVPTRQIVLFSSVDEYATRIAWRFAAVHGQDAPALDTGM